VNLSKLLFFAIFSSIFNLCVGAVGPQLTADNPMVFDDDTRSLTATGHAQLLDEKINLEADSIRFDEIAHSVSATGDVTLNIEQLRLVADSVSYDLMEGKFSSSNFRGGAWPVFLDGQQLVSDLNHATATNAVGYIGEPDWIAPNIWAKRITISKDNHYAEVEEAKLRVGSMPIFYWPRVKFDTRRSLLTFESNVGQRSQLGWYVKTLTLVPVIYPLKAGALLDYYTKRGILYGPAATYDFTGDNTEYRGDLRTGFIADHGNRGIDILGDPINKNRNFIEWRHKQVAYECVELTGALSWWSDSYVTRDFRPEYYMNNQTPDSFLQATYLGDNSYVTAMARPEPNEFELVAQRLPELNFHLNASPIRETGIIQQLDVSAVYLKLHPLNNTPVLESDRLNVLYSLMRPISLTHWSTFTPIAHGCITEYFNIKGTNGSDDYTRFLGEIGADLDATISGSWECDSGRWNLDGIRHVCRPVVQYRYLPQGNIGSGTIPVIDGDVFSTYLPIIDLAAMRNLDQITSLNVMRFGVRNTFQTRDDQWGTRELAYLHLFEDVRLETFVPEARTWSNVFVNLGFYPARWVNVGGVVRIDPYNTNLYQFQSYVSILDGELVGARVFTDYLRENFNQYGLEAFIKIDERNRLYGHWRYDYDLKTVTEQAYGYRLRLGNVWAAQLELVYRRDTSRENGIQMNFIISVLEFPILKV
jgi:LPS-assembly protein